MIQVRRPGPVLWLLAHAAFVWHVPPKPGAEAGAPNCHEARLNVLKAKRPDETAATAGTVCSEGLCIPSMNN